MYSFIGSFDPNEPRERWQVAPLLTLKKLCIKTVIANVSKYFPRQFINIPFDIKHEVQIMVQFLIA